MAAEERNLKGGDVVHHILVLVNDQIAGGLDFSGELKTAPVADLILKASNHNRRLGFGEAAQHAEGEGDVVPGVAHQFLGAEEYLVVAGLVSIRRTTF